MSEFETVRPLNILNEVLGINRPHVIPKPKVTRWNRNYNAMAEYYIKLKTISYPLREGHYLQVSGNMIKVPKLVFRVD